MLSVDLRQPIESDADGRFSPKETPESTHLCMALGIATHFAHAAQYSDDAIAAAYHALCQALGLKQTVHHVQPTADTNSKIHSRLPNPPIGHVQSGHRQDRPDDASLSARQQSILELIASGLSNKEIARSLGISPETVKTHINRIFVRLGVERRAQAVAFAHTLGMIQNTTTDQEAI